MIIFMCRQYEHAIAITNRTLVQGDFLEADAEGDSSASACGDSERERICRMKQYEMLAEKILEICRESGVQLLPAFQNFCSSQIRMQKNPYICSVASWL